jgi:hypothetical protein
VRNPTTWFQLGIIGDAGPEISDGLGAARSRKNTNISTSNPATTNTGRLRSHNRFLEMNLRTVSARIADTANGGKLRTDHRAASPR